MKKLFFLIVSPALVISVVVSCAQKTLKQRNISQVNVPTVLYSWSQYVGHEQMSFRAILADSECPRILIDGQNQQMKTRARLDETGSLQVCEFLADISTQSAQINDSVLPVTKELKSIVAFGDTGCRIKKVKFLNIMQDCNDPDGNKWPFEKISKSAAKQKPNLAIHLGDYNYRDASCPKGEKKCDGLATGATWESWEQDVVKPMSALLKTTPFIFVRGNHETCTKHGKIWFKLFSATDYPETANGEPAPCDETTPTFSVVLDQIEFINVDSTSDDHRKLEIINLKKSKNSKYLWLLTHKPFLAASADVDLKDTKNPVLSPNMIAPGALQAVLVGHTHSGSFTTFSNPSPPELILGNGGVMFDLVYSGPKSTKSAFVQRYKKHGYAYFKKMDTEDNDNPDVTTWQLSMMDKNGVSQGNSLFLQSAIAKTKIIYSKESPK